LGLVFDAEGRRRGRPVVDSTSTTEGDAREVTVSEASGSNREAV